MVDPKSRRILRRLPMPKYLRMSAKTMDKLNRKPFLEFVNITERVKKRARKRTKKNTGMAPKSLGLVKTIITESSVQRIIIIKESIKPLEWLFFDFIILF